MDESREGREYAAKLEDGFGPLPGGIFLARRYKPVENDYYRLLIGPICIWKMNISQVVIDLLGHNVPRKTPEAYLGCLSNAT